MPQTDRQTEKSDTFDSYLGMQVVLVRNSTIEARHIFILIVSMKCFMAAEYLSLPAGLSYLDMGLLTASPASWLQRAESKQTHLLAQTEEMKNINSHLCYVAILQTSDVHSFVPSPSQATTPTNKLASTRINISISIWI